MKKPALTPVQSSNIDAVGFDNYGLHVRFKGGGLYSYPDAPKALHDEMLRAESVGSFFRANVSGKFVHKKHDD
jgi:hypothetical protein